MHLVGRVLLLFVLTVSLGSIVVDTVSAEPAQDPCPPGVYVAGRDTPWVPTPDPLVEAMLDLLKLTPQDYVIDLGSGDGRIVIAAAKRGTPGHGVDFNPVMVDCANRRAQAAGVADKVSFIEGDMFEVDISKATALPLFLLPENLDQLMPTFLKLRPNTRIAVNGFKISNWEEDETVIVKDGCGHWCTAYLWIVPAQISGTWHSNDIGQLAITQKFQKISGTLSSNNGTQEVTGRLRGEQIIFKAGDIEYTGLVKGDAMSGASGSGAWSASRKGP